MVGQPNVSLRVPDRGEYDYVVALTQGQLNLAFAKIHEQRQDLSKIEVSNDAATLSGWFKAPRVIISSDPSLKTRPSWQITFDTGSSLTPKDNSSTPLDISNWVLTLQIELALSERQKIFQDDKVLSTLEQKYYETIVNAPGSYTPYRLYAILGTPFFAHHLKEASRCNTLSYKDWSDANKDQAKTFETFLDLWWKDLRTNLRTTLGSKFDFTSYRKNPKAVTFSPTQSNYQTYLGTSQSSSDPVKTGEDWNCLLICESVSSTQHNDDGRQIISVTPGANWATSATGAGDGSSGTAGSTSGTMAVNQYNFFRNLLLPELNIMQYASKINFEIDWSQYPPMKKVFAETDPSRAKNPSSLNPSDNYAWQYRGIDRQQTNGSWDGITYSAKSACHSQSPGYVTIATYVKFLARPKLTIQCHEGTNSISVSFKADYYGSYKMGSLLSSAEFNENEPDKHVNLFNATELQTSQTFTWDMEIRLVEISASVLTLQFSPEYIKLQATTEHSRQTSDNNSSNSWGDGDPRSTSTAWITTQSERDTLEKAINYYYKEVFQKRLLAPGPALFVLPGQQELDLSNPVFHSDGHILATSKLNQNIPTGITIKNPQDA